MKKNTTTKSDNFGNLNFLDTWLTRIAKEQFVTHRFSKEYRTVLVLVFLFDIVAVGVSIFAGYFYLYILIFKTLNNILSAKLITFISLIFLEFLVHASLAKFFKSFIKSKMQVALISLVTVALLWSASFHLSTKGLSMRQSKKVSKVEDISANFEIEKENLLKNRDVQIIEFQELQKEIKNNPTKWNKGKLSLLSSQQLTDIKEYQNEISGIKQQYRTDFLALQENTQKEYDSDQLNTQNEADEYYNIIVVIMFIELLASGFLMFSWYMILKENKPEDFANSKINDFATYVDNSVTALFKSRFDTLSNSLQLAIESHANNSIPFEFSDTSNGKSPEKESNFVSDAEIINKKNVGFQMQQTANEPVKKKEKTCAYCGVDISHKKHWNAKYCSETCKKTAWEKRTKRPLMYKKKK